MFAHEGVVQDFFEGGPAVWVAHQHLLEQVCRFGAERLGQAELAGEDFVVERRLALVVERETPAEHRVERDAAAPDVYFDGVVLFA